MTDPWCCYIWCSMDPINIPPYVSIFLYQHRLDPSCEIKPSSIASDHAGGNRAWSVVVQQQAMGFWDDSPGAWGIIQHQILNIYGFERLNRRGYQGLGVANFLAASAVVFSHHVGSLVVLCDEWPPASHALPARPQAPPCDPLAIVTRLCVRCGLRPTYLFDLKS